MHQLWPRTMLSETMRLVPELFAVFNGLVKYQLYGKYAHLTNGFSGDVFDIASRSTLLLVGNEEAKTLLFFALQVTVIPQLSNDKLQHQLFCTVFAISFLHDPSWTCTLALSCGDDKNSTDLTSLFTQANDARHAEARSNSLIDEVLA